MKTLTFNTEDAWLEARLGRITGTRLKDLISKNGSRKIGYYEIIAERIAIPANEENVMDRGHRLEEIALAEFAQKTKKKVTNELVIWHRDDDENIALSPDGTIGKTEAVEVKCLSSARHIEAYITKKIPDEYWYQVLQYFIVNDKLKKVYFLFYDPRMPIDLFWIEVKRTEVQEEIDVCLDIERRVLKEVEEYEQQLTI